MKLEEQVMDALHAIIDRWGLMYFPKQRRGNKQDMSDFSLLELHIIKSIALADGVLSLQEVRGWLNIPNSTLSSLVKRLESQGVLNREKSDEDGRAVLLRLTPFGYEVNHQHYCVDMEIATNFVSRIEQSDAEQFVKIIQKATRSPLVTLPFDKARYE